MVTLTFTGSPSEINADMYEMLNLQKRAATVPVKSEEYGEAPQTAGLAPLQKLNEEDRVREFKTKPVTMGEGPTKTVTEIAARTEEALDAAAVTGSKKDEVTAAKRRRRTKAEIEAAKSNGHADVPAAVGPSDDEPELESTTTAQTAAVAPPIINKETVAQALQQVNVVVGLPKAREILQSFGANRQSEIKEDQYRAFIEKCNEAVMLEG